MSADSALFQRFKQIVSLLGCIVDIIDDTLIEPTPSRFLNNDFKFLENPEFENHLYYYIITAANLDKSFYTPLKDKQDSIIRLIQSEIH